MFLSVAVSKAEVASSRSNSFGDLEIKNIYTRSYFRRYCSCTGKKCHIGNGSVLVQVYV